MKKIFIVFAMLLLAFSTHSLAQAKSIYFELGGPGLASFNFDTRFSNSEKGIGGRIGFGGYSIDNESTIFIPIGINYLLSRDEKNYFEIGGGVTPVIDNYGSGNFTSTFGHLSFGYRLQPKNGGFLFRANMVPIFGSGFFVPYYAGVSFGYKF